MTKSATDARQFSHLGSIPFAVDFLGGRLTSDGGLPWLTSPRRRSGTTSPSQRHCISRPVRKPKLSAMTLPGAEI